MHKRPLLLIFCLLAISVVIVYCNAVPADFIYDDYAFVYNNQEIRTLTPLSKFLLSPEVFSQPVSNHVYRPLASFTFALNYLMNGLEPEGYRLVNIIFHALNAFLLFLVMRRVGFSNLPAFSGALVFAVHPVHTEAVTWISGRGNVLFLFFLLIAYLLYAEMDDAPGSRRKLLLFGAVIAYALSLLAKEMALPLPALLFGHDLYVRKERNLKQRLKLYVPFVVVAVAYLALRAHVLGRVGQVEYHGGSAYATFLAMLRAVVIYMKLLLAPTGLSLSRHFEPLHSLLDRRVFFSFCIVVAAILVTVVLYRRAPRISFGFFWFAMALGPVSNIIPVNAIVADRFLYGPSIGFCMIAAAATSALAGLPSRYKASSAGALAGIFALLMLLTVGRNHDWRNPYLLWQKTAASSPTSYVALNNLALEYMKMGKIPEAVESLNKSLALRGDLSEVHVNLARCYTRLGRVEEALVHYSIARQLLKDDPAIQAEMKSLRQQMSIQQTH